MAVISLSLQKSKEEILIGIPKFVKVTTNIPSIIFYTLDGSDPDLYSEQYVDSIKIPTRSSVTLKIFATNGTDSSPIIEEVYSSVPERFFSKTKIGNTAPVGQQQTVLSYPFGSGSYETQPSVIDLNQNVGITVNDGTDGYSTGYDGYHAQIGFTNKPFDLSNYNIIYSTTDRQNKPLPAPGNLPSKVSFILEEAPPEETFYTKMLFNPKASVVYHDADSEDPEQPSLIFSGAFSIPPIQSKSQAPRNRFFIAGADVQPVTGGLVRQLLNPRTNKVNSYFYDSRSNRWIISQSTYVPNENPEFLQTAIFSKPNNSAGIVFKWIPNMRRYTF